MTTGTIASSIPTPVARATGLAGYFASLEQAFRVWLMQSTGLSEAQVYLAHEEAFAVPPDTSAVLSLGDFELVGQDEVSQTFEGAPAGEEVLLTVLGQRLMDVRVDFYGPTVPGDSTARVNAANAQAGLSKPSVRDALNAAGIGVLSIGAARSMPAINGTTWAARVMLELRCAVVYRVTERSTFIESVATDGTVIETPPSN